MNAYQYFLLPHTRFFEGLSAHLFRPRLSSPRLTQFGVLHLEYSSVDTSFGLWFWILS